MEQVKGTRAVTLRLQQELGGLTAEALLNSCLVAQKQLGRLETLNRASREEALTVLLNLNKLSEVHARLRVKSDDEERLRRARARLELARARVELSQTTEERAVLEQTRHLLTLRETLVALAAADEARGEAEAVCRGPRQEPGRVAGAARSNRRNKGRAHALATGA